MASKNTQNISLEYLLQNQASPEVTINESLNKIDALVFNIVQDIVDALPTNPNNGDVYICSAQHSQPNKIAIWLQNKGWQMIEPKIGLEMYSVAIQKRMMFIQSGWTIKEVSQGETPSLHSVATSGSYSELNNKPTFHSVANSGDYNQLMNKPSLHSVATSGSYSELNNKPTFHNICWSGSYNDLIDKPTNANSALVVTGQNGWYKKSSDGMIIQGGKMISGGGWLTHTLPIAFTNTIYSINVWNNGSYRSFNQYIISESQFRVESLHIISTDARYLAIGF